jgi:hypothetical protein
MKTLYLYNSPNSVWLGGGINQRIGKNIRVKIYNKISDKLGRAIVESLYRHINSFKEE